MTFWAASGFLWQCLASFIKNKIKQSKNKAICYHILVFTVLKEWGLASSQKIHQGRCFTFIKGQRDSCLFSELNLPVLYIPCIKETESRLPDYVLKISCFFIHICFFKPLLIISRLKLDTCNFEEVPMYEWSQSVRKLDIEFSSINRSENDLPRCQNLKDPYRL